MTFEGSVSAAWSERLPPLLQVEAYNADELNFHGGLRVSFGMQLMAAASRIEAEIPSIKWPFLLLHGDADKLCDMRGSTMMYENTPSSDKKFKVGRGLCPCSGGGGAGTHRDVVSVRFTSWFITWFPIITRGVSRK